MAGSIVGFSGAGGQLMLFQALRDGPAYLVFPIVSLYPVVTVALAVLFLKEITNRRRCGTFPGGIRHLPAGGVMWKSE
ncbi:EamA family transporter [Chitinophaga sp. MAH-28]|uniref:EamA family transporter n=1 Tax=Chitinophaga chungangae TaxID=2821488 RepID=A0ABS3YJ04_9BACT|nr:EamA family transporter [Chitinophaga chungangae]MBO9154682.1 EamA family transporter [Chitinophaga chungangae]